MATAAPTPRAAQSYGHHGSYRHHPYASSAASSSSSSARPKWQSNAKPAVDSREPPSPPRSRRETSETSTLGLGAAFGGAPGGKWWDEELPAPPSSLTSILDSFRRSGEGDRDLLLSILGAKKAEEERLTALIQTRLTVLQARLSIHSAAAQLSFSPPTPSVDGSTRDLPLVAERTPSLGGSSRASASSSTGPVSPTYMAPPPVPAQLASEKARGGYFTLPPPQSMLRSRSGSRSPPLGHRDVYPQMRIGERELRMPAPRSGSTSPKSTGSEGRAPGLDMLLDAGMERERRDSTEKR